MINVSLDTIISKCASYYLSNCTITPANVIFGYVEREAAKLCRQAVNFRQLIHLAETVGANQAKY